MEYEITDYITPEEYMEMRRLVEWSEFPLEQAVEGIKHSAYLSVFRKDGKVIALARVITDFGYVVYIADVIVHPDYQGQGLGRKLMEDIMAYIKGQLKPGYKKMVSLMAAECVSGLWLKNKGEGLGPSGSELKKLILPEQSVMITVNKYKPDPAYFKASFC